MSLAFAKGLLKAAGNTSKAMSPIANAVVQVAKSLTMKDLLERAKAIIEQVRTDETLEGKANHQEAILLDAIAATLLGQVTTDLAFWRGQLETNKKLTADSHPLAKAATG